MRLSGEAFTDYRATPWRTGEALRTGYRAIGNYRYNFLENLDFNIRASWEENQDGTELDGSADFNWYPGDFRFTVGAEYNYTDSVVEFDETNYFFSVTWNWFSDAGDYSARVDYQSLLNVGRVTVAKNNRNTPGSIGFEANADVGEDIQVYSLRTNYTANRYSGEVEYSYLTNTATDSQTQNISTRLSTAVSIFDTDVAWSRSYFGPAAIVKVHDSLDADVYINEYYDEEPQSIATKTLNNTAPLYGSHNETRVLVTVPDAPVGYNYGNDVRVIVPGTYTGHIIEVGSNQNRTVIGTCLMKRDNL
ncbi:P pilus assembly protein [Vibrio sp. JCM 19236]|nr:P pilus assembly protein [Vibrio sp. JCM 19236]